MRRVCGELVFKRPIEFLVETEGVIEKIVRFFNIKVYQEELILFLRFNKIFFS